MTLEERLLASYKDQKEDAAMDFPLIPLRMSHVQKEFNDPDNQEWPRWFAGFLKDHGLIAVVNYHTDSIVISEDVPGAKDYLRQLLESGKRERPKAICIAWNFEA